MKVLRKRNKLIKESTDVLIKLKISVPDVDNCNSCNVVDSLLNEIWDAAVDDTVDDVYGMDWNEEDSNESGRDRKIYGLKQHNRNLEDKLGRIGGYHYGNPKQ